MCLGRKAIDRTRWFATAFWTVRNYGGTTRYLTLR
jgi:hypothetical protein